MRSDDNLSLAWRVAFACSSILLSLSLNRTAIAFWALLVHATTRFGRSHANDGFAIAFRAVHQDAIDSGDVLRMGTEYERFKRSFFAGCQEDVDGEPLGRIIEVVYAGSRSLFLLRRSGFDDGKGRRPWDKLPEGREYFEKIAISDSESNVLVQTEGAHWCPRFFSVPNVHIVETRKGFSRTVMECVKGRRPSVGFLWEHRHRFLQAVVEIHSILEPSSIFAQPSQRDEKLRREWRSYVSRQLDAIGCAVADQKSGWHAEMRAILESCSSSAMQWPREAPLLHCHRDLHYGNILIRGEANNEELCFIDWDAAGVSVIGTDLLVFVRGFVQDGGKLLEACELYAQMLSGYGIETTAHEVLCGAFTFTFLKVSRSATHGGSVRFRQEAVTIGRELCRLEA